MLENCYNATMSTSPSDHTGVLAPPKINRTEAVFVVCLFEEEMVSWLSDTVCSSYYMQINKRLNSSFKSKLPILFFSAIGGKQANKKPC